MPVIVPDVTALPTTESAQPIYDRPALIAELYAEDGGPEHYVVTYPPGLRGRRHTHSVAHTMIVLDGVLVAEGQRVGPGGYVRYAAGEEMLHEPDPETGCRFVVVFDGPFDVTPTR